MLRNDILSKVPGLSLSSRTIDEIWVNVSNAAEGMILKEGMSPVRLAKPITQQEYERVAGTPIRLRWDPSGSMPWKAESLGAVMSGATLDEVIQQVVDRALG